MMDAVQTTYPFQLIGGFQFFGNALSNFHLGKQEFHVFLANSVDTVQMCHDFTGEQELIKQEL